VGLSFTEAGPPELFWLPGVPVSGVRRPPELFWLPGVPVSGVRFPGVPVSGVTPTKNPRKSGGFSN